VPLRKTFVQRPRSESPRHGPLHDFVRRGDLRGLQVYLLIVAATSSENADGWTTTLDSAVWARLFDAQLTATDQAARTAAWRILKRLEEHKLITCFRPRGGSKIAVTLLREDGSGAAYTRPDGRVEADRFLRLPTTFWTSGFAARIDVPGLAMLLTIAREKPWSRFPAERTPEWYGWSPDTTLRGLKQLQGLGLIERREAYDVAPLSPSGSTLVYEYCLAPWLRPEPGKRREPEVAS
jgi:hypothetical protein